MQFCNIPYSRNSVLSGLWNGYQFGQPEAFVAENIHDPQTIDGPYVDGVTLTYGTHLDICKCITDERGGIATCPCTSTNRQATINMPSLIGNDYFCETGVSPGQSWSVGTFCAIDSLWDGQGCGLTSSCCTFNNPPWFCKQLLQSTK